jgi:glycosyltransferase involved in cell wall biosynthesis
LRPSIKQPEDFNDEGLATYYHFTTSVTPASRFLNYSYFVISAYRKFKQYVAEHGKPDVLHAHSVFGGGIVARFLSKKYDIPYVITEHYSGLIINNISHIGFNKKIVKKVFADAVCTISVSKSFKDALSAAYELSPEIFTVVPNMVAPTFFFNNSDIRPEIGDEPVFFANSFLTPNKNHKLLLDSFRLVLNQKPKAVLNIGGNGQILHDLKEYAQQLQLGDSVNFLGELNRAEVKQQLELCDIFTSTSRYETFGIAIIEALACGKPVVVTDSGGPRDIVGRQDGILVEKHDPLSFSDAMIEICGNYSDYDRQAIKERCYERFSQKVIVNQLINIYSKSLGS